MQFHWRFSKGERHHKQAKNSLKAKPSAREQQTAEEKQGSELEVAENAKNSEAQLPTTESSLQFPVISDQQLVGVEDGRTEALECKDVPICDSDVCEAKLNSGHNVDRDVRDLCLNQEGMQESCAGQTLEELCSPVAYDGNCEAETTETCFESRCEGD